MIPHFLHKVFVPSHRKDKFLNILFISPNSPFESVGGVERYLTNLIEYCKNKTSLNTVILVPTSKPSFIQKDGIVTIYHENLIDMTKNGSPKEYGEKAKKLTVVIESILQDFEINIICAENFPVGLPPAYSIMLNILAVRYDIPLVLRLHSFASTPLQTELINQLMWNRISCVSKSVAGDCFNKGADIEILSTDYLGVNTKVFNNITPVDNKMRERLGLTLENKVILTATRIIQNKKNILKEKGLINLIQAFSKISRRYPEARLVIGVGRAPDRLKDEFDSTYLMLEGYLTLNDVKDKVIIEMFTLDEMPEVYRIANIFVLASENETFGQVFVESMGSGVPVIGTNVGGIPEVISDSRNGYLIQPEDSSILAQKIEILLTNQTIVNNFKQAGIEVVHRKFSLEKQLDEFIVMLKSIV